MHAGRDNKNYIHIQSQSLPHRMDKGIEKSQRTTLIKIFKYKCLFSIRPIFFCRKSGRKGHPTPRNRVSQSPPGRHEAPERSRYLHGRQLRGNRYLSRQARNDAGAI